MIKHIIATLLCLLLSGQAWAQHTLQAKIVDADSGEPLPGATLKISASEGAVADIQGLVNLTGITTDTVEVTVSYVGYQHWTQRLVLPLTEPLLIELEHGEELEEVIVTATRSSRTIENLPTRVEVISTEELEEKSMMRSANIAMLLRESTGIQMQQTSASSGNQSIRIQGLDGRYTQILKDGFPLYGGFGSGLSVMQIPPLDLRQVEVIKGSHSTLYGGGAIAGLVNLVTITPQEERRLRLMLDQTTALGTTANGFYAERFGAVGVSMYVSANRQQAYDPNGDAFSDIPQIRNFTLNPSVFFYFKDESQLRITLNYTGGERLGGTMQGNAVDSSGNQGFYELNDTRRGSYQLTYQKPLGEYRSLTVKHSLVGFDRQLTQNDFTFQGRQWASFSEAALHYGSERSQWTSGLNVYSDDFREIGVPEAAARDYAQLTLGAFTQNTWDINPTWALESGLRLDYEPNYGPFVLPRVSLLGRFNEHWSARLGGGAGYKLPTLATEEAESQVYVGIETQNLESLAAERSLGANLDLNYQTALGSDWTFSVNQLFFYTRLQQALVLGAITDSTYAFQNADAPVTSQGMETNLKLTFRDFKLFANYAFADTRLGYDNPSLQKPLTPRHSIGSVLMWEAHGKGRVGLEAYYTGEQRLADGTTTQPFWIVGLMAMRKWKAFSFYINFENLTDTRQHRLEAFDVREHLRPEFPQIWAPLDGRIINAGIIIDL